MGLPTPGRSSVAKGQCGQPQPWHWAPPWAPGRTQAGSGWRVWRPSAATDSLRGLTQILGHGGVGLFPRNWAGTGRPLVSSAPTINSKAVLPHTTATCNLLVFTFFQLVQVCVVFSCDGHGQIPAWKSILSPRAEPFQAVRRSRSPWRKDHSIFFITYFWNSSIEKSSTYISCWAIRLKCGKSIGT